MIEGGSLSGFPRVEQRDIDVVIEERRIKAGQFIHDVDQQINQFEPNFLRLLGLRTDPVFGFLGAVFAASGACTVWRILQEVDPNLPAVIPADVPQDKLSLKSTTYKDENGDLMRFIENAENEWQEAGRFFRIGALSAYEMKRHAFQRTRKRIN